MAEPDEATINALRRVQDRVRQDAESLIEKFPNPELGLGVHATLSLLDQAITQEFAPLFEEN